MDNKDILNREEGTVDTGATREGKGDVGAQTPGGVGASDGSSKSELTSLDRAMAALASLTEDDFLRALRADIARRRFVGIFCFFDVSVPQQARALLFSALPPPLHELPPDQQLIAVAGLTRKLLSANQQHSFHEQSIIDYSERPN